MKCKYVTNINMKETRLSQKYARKYKYARRQKSRIPPLLPIYIFYKNTCMCQNTPNSVLFPLKKTPLIKQIHITNYLAKDNTYKQLKVTQNAQLYIYKNIKGLSKTQKKKFETQSSQTIMVDEKSRNHFFDTST
eukprot:TRINITY_DN6972_c0_g2_i4.p3 TRINITY_DN6972_c0_g2~~TRINITY_DN6972_c0_g2_i4.p3  ORF type:complete len:134 (-),score=1.84 TRINITY_DN6972_c0_g2_i4:401-802(-)